MNVKKITSLQKIFLFLIANIILFGGFFTLRILGIATDLIQLFLAMAVSLEVICLAFFIQMSVNRNTRSLEEMEKNIENIREDEEKVQNVLIYMGHQMRAMQHELDIFRKGAPLKPNGNGHHPKLHI